MKIEKIKSPSFLNDLNNKELELLSEDIRTFIIKQISQTGGHLSSNLGTVDLIIAMHKVFDSPKDKFFFDVGHQTYTHKILTGRAKDFDQLRKHNGLSGFLKKSESKHDAWEAGHTSTSLSGAFGAAIARDLNKENHKVIAVIGDGAMTGGMAYEAMNHIGSLDKDLIVILNDNTMSISENVGAMHNSLDKLRVSKKYLNTKTSVKKTINKFPYLGRKITGFSSRISKVAKSSYNKKGLIFTELGFKYYGPIHGHDYDEMLLYLKMAKKLKGPVLIHVITEKGKGYTYSELDKQGSWHGTSPFNIETGETYKKKTDLVSWSKVISNNLVRLAKDNKDIVCLTPAMKKGSSLDNFEEEFPERFFDVGIAEEHAVTMATSLANEGKRPFMSIYSTFLQRAYDQVLHDTARMNVPLVFGIDRAGIVGADGETHQGLFDISFLSHIPHINIVMPKDSIEAANLMYTAFNQNKPIAIRYPRGEIKYSEKPFEKIPFGSWDKIEAGKDGYLIAYGNMLDDSLAVKNELLKDKINLEVINARFIKPFDVKMLKRIAKSNKPIFIYEEAMKKGGLGSMILEYLSDNDLPINVRIFAIDDKFVLQGNRDELMKDLKLDTKSICKSIKKYMR